MSTNPVTRQILTASLAAMAPTNARRLAATFGVPIGKDHKATVNNILAATEAGDKLHAVCYVEFVRPSANVEAYRERLFRVKYEQGRGDADAIKDDFLVSDPGDYPAKAKKAVNPAKAKAKKAVTT